MIVTVTLNPALDRTLSVPALQPGAIHRARLIRQDVGGKGINTSRALRALGIPSRIAGWVGGATGTMLCEGLAAQGYDAHWIQVTGETRQNVTLLDLATNEYTKINEAGPSVEPAQIAALESWIAGAAQPGDLWAFCGSLPPGTPDDLYARLIASVQARGARACLDTAGPALAHGVRATPFVVKINTHEAAKLLGRAIDDDSDVAGAVQALRRMGVPLVILTRGERGLALGTGNACALATPPAVAAASAVGAGDATLAGLFWGLRDRAGPDELARRAVACGTAAAMQTGSGVGDRALVEGLLPRIMVTYA